MNAHRISTGLGMILRMLVRRRIVIILLAVIPAVFLGVVAFTTSERILPFRLASLENEVFIEIGERAISFVFFAVASAGFLVSFLALDLIQRNRDTNRRLVICGYHPLELLIADLLALLLVILIIAVYIGLLTNLLFTIDHLLHFMMGLALIGFVYGCYGLVVGSLIRGELEGILMIVLLVNIDAGWLQNPLFYAEAQNQLIIRFLPAYYPSQASIIAAFTDYSIVPASKYSIIYGSLLLIISMLFFFKKMRTKK